MQTMTKTKIIHEADLAQRAVDIGRKNNRTFIILPQTGKLTEEIHVGDKIFKPFEEDDSIIPRVAWESVEFLREGDERGSVPIIDMIVMHDDPIAQMVLEKQHDWEPQKQQLKGALTYLGNFALGLVGGLALASAVLLDPGLICVLGDERESWILVCFWHKGHER